MEGKGESVIAARRAEAARGPASKKSPSFGQPPFYGYMRVFYVDVIVGALVGGLALRHRTRRIVGHGSTIWTALGAGVGTVAGAVVFWGVLMLSTLMLFLNPPSTLMMLVFTLVLIALGGVPIAFGIRPLRSPRRR